MQTAPGSVRIPIIAEVDSVAAAVQAVRHPHRARFTRVVWRLHGNQYADWGRVHLIPLRFGSSPVGRLTLCSRLIPPRILPDILIGEETDGHNAPCQYCHRHEAWR